LGYSKLGICIDSDSINSVYHSRKDIVDRLLLYYSDNNQSDYYHFVRSAYISSPNIVSTIPETQYSKDDDQKVDIIARNALKGLGLTEGEKNFLLSIYNYSGQSQTLDVMESGHNIKDKLFVTENEEFLSRRYSTQSVSIESFFPGIRLVNLHDCLDIMDLFAKTHDLYLRSPKTNASMNKGYWYWIYFRWKVPHYNVPIPRSSSLTALNDILHALGKRICYLLIAVDELGKLHHFNSDDEIMILYHFNYILSLMTGIFDNLAIHTRDKYGISFPSGNIPSRFSLKNNGGGDFLKEVQKHNPALRNHIRSYNDFISFIHDLRDKVIHAEGRKEIGVFFVYKISTFIPIDNGEEGKIRLCGDKPGPYKKYTEWGVYKYVTPNTNTMDFFLIPYYFAKSATTLILKFVDEYLELTGQNRFLDKLEVNDEYYQMMTEFGQLSLRGIKG
jgi:hypothetical protein